MVSLNWSTAWNVWKMLLVGAGAIVLVGILAERVIEVFTHYSQSSSAATLDNLLFRQDYQRQSHWQAHHQRQQHRLQ